MTDPTGSDPASRAVDKMAGKAKQLAGAVTGNDELKHEGQLHEQKADAAREAQRLSAGAETEQAHAEVTAEQGEIEVGRQRLAAEETSEAREARKRRGASAGGRGAGRATQSRARRGPPPTQAGRGTHSARAEARAPGTARLWGSKTSVGPVTCGSVLG